MDGKSLDITQDKLNRLKELFPEAFSEEKVDWEKLKAVEYWLSTNKLFSV